MAIHNSVIQILEFGVLGLCAIMLIAAWRILYNEQKREGEPRTGIMRFTLLFMGFCLVLAVLNSWVQLSGGGSDEEFQSQIQTLESQLQEERDKLLRIRSAAEPLLNVRGSIINQLPDSLHQKTVLADLLSELRSILQ